MLNNETMQIRKAEITDLKEIQNLNKMLFELEFKNFDLTLDVTWCTSKEGTEYYEDAIKNSVLCQWLGCKFSKLFRTKRMR